MSYTEIETKHVRRAKIYAAFMLGWGVSLYSLPAQALDSTLTQESLRTGELQVVYYPATSAFLAAMFIIPIVYAGYTLVQNRSLENRYTAGESNEF